MHLVWRGQAAAAVRPAHADRQEGVLLGDLHRRVPQGVQQGSMHTVRQRHPRWGAQQGVLLHHVHEQAPEEELLHQAQRRLGIGQGPGGKRAQVAGQWSARADGALPIRELSRLRLGCLSGGESL